MVSCRSGILKLWWARARVVSGAAAVTVASVAWRMSRGDEGCRRGRSHHAQSAWESVCTKEGGGELDEVPNKYRKAAGSSCTT